jgi:hypothetical protein
MSQRYRLLLKITKDQDLKKPLEVQPVGSNMPLKSVSVGNSDFSAYSYDSILLIGLYCKSVNCALLSDAEIGCLISLERQMTQVASTAGKSEHFRN